MLSRAVPLPMVPDRDTSESAQTATKNSKKKKKRNRATRCEREFSENIPQKWRRQQGHKSNLLFSFTHSLLSFDAPLASAK